MIDLISREAALKCFHSWVDKYGDVYTPDEMPEYQAIEALPSAQPDIIACGDCIHWICHDRRCGYWNHGVKPLDWCCHAERRNDG